MLRDTVPCALTGGGIDREHLADHQPVEQLAYGRQPLLDAR